MACSKIFSGDLPELTSDIIQYLQNDLSTLHSCILVNRIWCRLSIPLLWENPFSVKLWEVPFSMKFPKNYRFIEIYLHNLDEEDKRKLNEYGINNDLLPSNTLFNYPSFIKYLDTCKVRESIKTWAQSVIVSSNFEKVSILTSFTFLSLIKIFIKNEVNLYTLKYEIEVITYNDYLNSALFQLILQTPNLICNVKNLSIRSNGFFHKLPFVSKCIYSNCSSISSLYIYSFGFDIYEKDLLKVISSQQNLKKLYFDFNINFLKDLKFSNRAANSLKTIIFHQILFDNLKVNFKEVFEQLNVLESIHFLYCYFSNSNIIQQIINLTKPFKLKSLFMNDNNLKIEPLKLLLQKSGNYLENVGFESLMYVIKLQFIELVKIYCIKIKFMSLLVFNDQNIYSTFDFIKNFQQNLNYLIISNIQSSNVILCSIVLGNLGQILPYRLEYLSLGLKRFNLNNDLELFFKNSQNVFIKKLLFKNMGYQDGEYILHCIKKFVMKEERIAYLAIKNVNSEGKDLFYLKNEVEEFKSYGIQVIDCDNLCIDICDFIDKLD